MQAYGSACIAYAQQFFAYTNRDLVNSGHYGQVQGVQGVQSVPGIGIGIHGVGVGVGVHGVGVPDSIASGETNPSSDTNTLQQPQPQSQPIIGVGMGGITMPVRIDPEEEKRLAILRSRVAASEAKREILETEYLSLRAHYVHESHKLSRARSVVTGQLKLLKDLVGRRGAVLALYRVRYALAMEILHSLEYRSKMLKLKESDLLNCGGSDGGNGDGSNNGSGGNTNSNSHAMTTIDENQTQNDNGNAMNSGNAGDANNVNATDGGATLTPDGNAASGMNVDSSSKTPNDDDKGDTSTAMEGVEYTAGTGTGTGTATGTATTTTADKNNETDKPNSNSDKTPIVTPNRDMGEVWDMLETELQEAEFSCTNKVETPEELLLMKAALAADAAALEAATEKASLGNGSSLYQRRSRSPPSRPEDEADGSAAASAAGGGAGGGGGGKKKNGDKSSKRKGSVGNDEGGASSDRDGAGGSGSGGKKSSSSKVDADPNLIPWNCPVLPRTPYDVAILLSNMSTAPDGAAAFGKILSHLSVHVFYSFCSFFFITCIFSFCLIFVFDASSLSLVVSALAACGDCNGNSSDSLLWLESNLPNSQEDEMDKEEERLLKARDKVKALSEELSREVKANSDLQRDIIKGRKRRDQLCAMMSMIRSETEAVIERYEKIT